MGSDPVQMEESKRTRNWDPVRRWRELQAAIEWADAQAPVPRNCRAFQLLSQREKLDAMEGPEVRMPDAGAGPGREASLKQKLGCAFGVLAILWGPYACMALQTCMYPSSR